MFTGSSSTSATQFGGFGSTWGTKTNKSKTESGLNGTNVVRLVGTPIVQNLTNSEPCPLHNLGAKNVLLQLCDKNVTLMHVVVIVKQVNGVNNKPAQTNRTLRSCKCKGAQYCNNTCYQAHWKEHKPEHNRLVKLLPSTGETKEAPTEDTNQFSAIPCQIVHVNRGTVLRMTLNCWILQNYYEYLVQCLMSETY